MKKVTEQSSNHQDLDKKSIREILTGINEEDTTVPQAIARNMDAIENLVTALTAKMKIGGRLFYLGAGTSGRLGVVDASECPPTYGVPHGLVVGLIAGGDKAIRKAVEFAEDSSDIGWNDLLTHQVTDADFVIGIAASGTTPYVIGALEKCNERGIATGCIVCNEGSPVAAVAKYPIECVVGPEYVTGSTRMKAGTAQKLILNMISTAAMIQLGRVKGNKMVDMQLSNNKLVARGTLMIQEATGVDEKTAAELLDKHGSVRLAVDAWHSNN